MALTAATLAAAVRLRRGDGGPLDTPDTTGYDPVELLCTHGKDARGEKKIQGWCKDWVSCIKSKAAPEGTPAAVMKAWSPADCKEICGEWPSMTPKEGAKKAALVAMGANSTDCQASCTKFQDSLSTCVSKLIFEPGKISTMKGPQTKAAKGENSAFCSMKDTHCLPDLPIKAQRCTADESKAIVSDKKWAEERKKECKIIQSDFEDCKDCPQLKDNYGSHYTAFVGGCMDQLNAYWQAAHPSAGKHAVPGATGCTVH